MRRYSSTLVGLSLDDAGTSVSPGSRQAVEQALWFAQHARSSATLVHALGDAEVPRPTPKGVPPGGLSGDAALAAAPEPVARFVREVRALHADLGFELLPGAPWRALSRRAAGRDDVMLVVAKRNALDPRTHRLGSAATRLVHVCPAPVWVVHGKRPFPHRNVLAATDLTPVGALATRIGAWFAKELPGQLEVVHAWQLPMELEFERASLEPAELERRLQAIAESSRQQIVAGLEGADRDVPTKLHIGNAVPSQAILELIERYDVDLLVLGTKGRAGLPGALIGNTAERLLHEVDCSLLAVKPEGFRCPELD